MATWVETAAAVAVALAHQSGKTQKTLLQCTDRHQVCRDELPWGIRLTGSKRSRIRQTMTPARASCCPS